MGLVDSILDNIFDDKWVGSYGEKLTERELKLVKLFGRKGKTLRNVYVPKDDGSTSEIDLLYITQKGIFVFESKNYSGWIFCDEKSPKCGSKMVLRTATKGENKGNQFWGCSSFPKCRYILNIK